MRLLPLSENQARFVASDCPIKALCGGVGSGKTTIGAYDMLKRMKPGRLYLVVSATYPMLRDATLRTFLALARDLGILQDFLRSEMRVTVRVPGGLSEAIFRSGDDPDRLRGPNCSGVWLDEASVMSRAVYEIALGRLREAGEAGWLTATFTPKGRKHWTYEAFTSSEAFLVVSRTADNPFLEPKFLETVRSQYSSLLAAQELEGQFVEIEGAEFDASWFGPQAFFAEWPKDIALRVVALDPSKGKDAKFGDYSAFVRLGMDAAMTMYVEADLYRMPSSQVAEHAAMIQKEFCADAFAIEANVWQELLATDVEEAAGRIGVSFPTVLIQNKVNKQVRIRRLTPFLSRGKFRFRGGHAGTDLLVQQLREFPVGEHDDGPDALEIALRLVGMLSPEIADLREKKGFTPQRDTWQGLAETAPARLGGDGSGFGAGNSGFGFDDDGSGFGW